MSAFHLFPGMAFLKHLELVTFAHTCKVRVICLAPSSKAASIQIDIEAAVVHRRPSI